MSSCVVCLTTVSSRKEAGRLSRHLVKKRLVACVNVVPDVLSFFDWKGKACREREFLLVMKTVRTRVKRLQRELKREHPCEVPEFIVLPIQDGLPAYLKWVRKNTRG